MQLVLQLVFYYAICSVPLGKLVITNSGLVTQVM